MLHIEVNRPFFACELSMACFDGPCESKTFKKLFSLGSTIYVARLL